MKLLVSENEYNFLFQTCGSSKYSSITDEVRSILESRDCSDEKYVQINDWISNYLIEYALDNVNISAMSEGVNDAKVNDQFCEVLNNVLYRSKMEDVGLKEVTKQKVQKSDSKAEQEDVEVDYASDISGDIVPSHLLKIQTIIDKEIAKALKEQIKKNKALEKEVLELKDKIKNITQLIGGLS